MGMLDKLKSGRGKIRDSCDTDRETGSVTCRTVRVNQDGTEVEVAGFTMEADADCNPVQTSSFDDGDGSLERLEKKKMSKIIGKCKNRPADY